MIAAAIDKGGVARNFSAAAGSYDVFATAQAAIARALVASIPSDAAPARIADLGCGTGTLSGLLLDRFPASRLVGVDLAEGMVARCRARWAGEPRALFLAGDAEEAGAIPSGTDLIASSCAAQWFADLPGTLRTWAGALPSGGLLALAALVRGAFPELDAAHAVALGVPFPGLDFPEEGMIPDRLRECGLRVLAASSFEAVSSHAGSLEALRSFRRIGARIPGRAPMPPAALRRLLRAMERGGASGPRTLTHRALLVVARKVG